MRLAGMQGLLAVPFLAWIAEPVSVRAAAPGESVGVAGRSRPSAVHEEHAGGSAPLPEVAPATSVPLGGATPDTGWFAYRDARTGELVVPPPRILERLGTASRLERATIDAALVERRLPNGAVEIDLPEELASPLYGWIDEGGELHTGHEPPPRVFRDGTGGPGADERRGRP